MSRDSIITYPTSRATVRKYLEEAQADVREIAGVDSVFENFELRRKLNKRIIKLSRTILSYRLIKDRRCQL